MQLWVLWCSCSKFCPQFHFRLKPTGKTSRCRTPLDRRFCRDTIFMSSRWLSVPAVIITASNSLRKGFVWFCSLSIPCVTCPWWSLRACECAARWARESLVTLQGTISLPSQPGKQQAPLSFPSAAFPQSPSPAHRAAFFPVFPSNQPKQSKHSQEAERKQALESRHRLKN